MYEKFFNIYRIYLMCVEYAIQVEIDWIYTVCEKLDSNIYAIF